MQTNLKVKILFVLFLFCANTLSFTSRIAYADDTTEAPTLIFPAASSSYESPIHISYILGEPPMVGSVSISFIGETIITLTMFDDPEVDFNLDIRNISDPAIAATTAEKLPPGVYDVTISYQDAAGSPANTATNMNVEVLDITPEPSLEIVGTSFSSLDGIPIIYSIPVTPLDDSVSVAIVNIDDSTFITLPNTSGTDLEATLAVEGLLADGTYSLTLSYQDEFGSPIATDVVSDIVIATPTLNTVAVTTEQDASLAEVTVTLSSGSTGDITVDYTTSDGTAEAGTDYTESTGTLTWSTGDTDAKTISIPLTTTESSDGKAFNLILSNAAGAVIDNDTRVITLSSSADALGDDDGATGDDDDTPGDDTSGDDDTETPSNSGGCHLQTQVVAAHSKIVAWLFGIGISFVLVLRSLKFDETSVE